MSDSINPVEILSDKIEKLEEQLKEANKLIKWADKAFHFGANEDLSMFGKYLEKWGIE